MIKTIAVRPDKHFRMGNEDRLDGYLVRLECDDVGLRRRPPYGFVPAIGTRHQKRERILCY